MANTTGTKPSRRDIEEELARAHEHWRLKNGRESELGALRVLKMAPGEPRALSLLSMISLNAGNMKQAIRLMIEACKTPDVPAVYHANLGEMFRRVGDLNNAVKGGRNAVARDPKMAAAWNNLGIALQESGEIEESERALRRAMALSPDNAEYHNNLGNTLRRKGDIAGARTQWQRAMGLTPSYAEPYSNLSLLLIDEGDFIDAIRMAAKAIKLNPQLADAYANLAQAEVSRTNYRGALKVTEDGLRRFPDHAAMLCARSSALRNLDRVDEAITAARQATAASPNNGDSYVVLGQALQTKGEFEPAIEAYARAGELPGNARERAMVNRAALLMEHGDKEAAEQAFKAAVEAYPMSAGAWFNRSDLVKFKPDDPGFDKMKHALESTPRTTVERTLLNFALGKAYLDIGQSDLAFKYLNEGNALKRGTISYDPASSTSQMKRAADIFSLELLTTHAGQGAASNVPIFVVGMPRSGTTLLEQILSSHPLVHGAGELRTFQHAIDRRVRSYPDDVPSLNASQFADIGKDYLDHLPARPPGVEHIVDKMPANFFHAGMIHLALPGAKIVHSRRDAVDTCLSCYSKLFQSEQSFSYNFAELGQFYQDYEKLMGHWRSVLPSTAFFEIDYEAVVDDTEGQVRGLLAFLGLPWHEACLAFHQNKRTVRTASVNQVRQPIYKTSAGKWKKHAENLGPLLTALGKVI